MEQGSDQNAGASADPIASAMPEKPTRRQRAKSVFKGLFGKSLRLLVAVGILVLGVLGFRLLLATGEEPAARPRIETVHSVRVAEVLLADTRPVVTAYGTVAAVNRAELRFATAGEVAEVNPSFRSGITVEAGEELARLDDELLVIARDEAIQRRDSRRSDFIFAEKSLAQSRRDHKRTADLFDAGLSSEAYYERSRLELDTAENALIRARTAYREAELALARANRNLREARLVAPFRGVLTDVRIGVGQYVAGGQGGAALAVISDLGDLEISFVVPSEIYSKGARLIGTPVEIIWKAGGRDVVRIQGRIRRSEGAVSVAEGGGRLYAAPVDSVAAASALPPGAFVEVRIPSLPLENVATLPDSALFDNNTVYVINTEGRSEARSVRVLGRGEGNIYVNGALENGELVITTRIPGLGGGVKVRPYEQ